ncbi:MAG: RNA pseudouridine synthase, partial [Chloroflexales bacterium]|nr:RNA pseudouridine synthase [Chloroflexales bacterium]
EGAQVAVHRPPGGRYAEVDIKNVDILYEDAWLIALNKRAGWYSVATPWDIWGNVLAALGRFLALREGQPPPLHLAHQLDRDTSGVLLVSRDPRANAPLLATFAGRAAHKQYWCICAGVPATEQFSLHTGHGRSAGGRFRVYPLEEVGRTLPGGSRVKDAHTDFTLLQPLPDPGLSHDEGAAPLVTPPVAVDGDNAVVVVANPQQQGKKRAAGSTPRARRKRTAETPDTVSSVE